MTKKLKITKNGLKLLTKEQLAAAVGGSCATAVTHHSGW
jgi:hypothetical protein